MVHGPMEGPCTTVKLFKTIAAARTRTTATGDRGMNRVWGGSQTGNSLQEARGEAAQLVLTGASRTSVVFLLLLFSFSADLGLVAGWLGWLTGWDTAFIRESSMHMELK